MSGRVFYQTLLSSSYSVEDFKNGKNGASGGLVLGLAQTLSYAILVQTDYFSSSEYFPRVKLTHTVKTAVILSQSSEGAP